MLKFQLQFWQLLKDRLDLKVLYIQLTFIKILHRTVLEHFSRFHWKKQEAYVDLIVRIHNRLEKSKKPTLIWLLGFMNRLEDGFRKELNGQPLIPKLVKTSLKVFGILSGSPGNPENIIILINPKSCNWGRFIEAISYD